MLNNQTSFSIFDFAFISSRLIVINLSIESSFSTISVANTSLYPLEDSASGSTYEILSDVTGILNTASVASSVPLFEIVNLYFNNEPLGSVVPFAFSELTLASSFGAVPVVSPILLANALSSIVPSGLLFLKNIVYVSYADLLCSKFAGMFALYENANVSPTFIVPFITIIYDFTFA